MARRRADEIEADAVQAFARALHEALDEAAVVHRSGDSPGLTVSVPGGPNFAVDVKAIARRAEPGPVANALRSWDAQLATLRARNDGEVVGVLVAGAVPAATKAILRAHGWGWFDRRGEIDVRAPGLVLHRSDLTPSTTSAAPNHRDPIRGRAGITTAACLLLEPGRPGAVREIARRGELAPSTVSDALADLRAAALLDDDRRPLVPELFWALADAWKPARHAFAEAPTATPRLALRFDALDAEGWAVGNTVAAAAWGAPVAARADAPPDFYVPSERELRAAQHELRAAHTIDERACTIAVAPTVLVVRPRYASPSAAAPLVHPVFVALDLALDRARGVEILNDWEPPPPFVRVW